MMASLLNGDIDFFLKIHFTACDLENRHGSRENALGLLGPLLFFNLLFYFDQDFLL